MTYNRYSYFSNDGGCQMVPFIEIVKKPTDLFDVYYRDGKRLDMLSSDYYGSPDYAWLIMQANPELGSLEYEIPDRTQIRIPFPLDETLRLYTLGIEKHRKLY